MTTAVLKSPSSVELSSIQPIAPRESGTKSRLLTHTSESAASVAHEDFFLLAPPALDLLFALQSVRPRRLSFRVDDADRSSRRRVAPAASFVVLALTRSKVGRFSNVETAVCATQEVDVVHVQTTMPSSGWCRKQAHRQLAQDIDLTVAEP